MNHNEVCYCGHPEKNHVATNRSASNPMAMYCLNCSCQKFIRRENERNGDNRKCPKCNRRTNSDGSCPFCGFGIEVVGDYGSPVAVPVPQSECDHKSYTSTRVTVGDVTSTTRTCRKCGESFLNPMFEPKDSTKAKYTAEHHYDFGELKSESYEQGKKAIEDSSKQDKVEEIITDNSRLNKASKIDEAINHLEIALRNDPRQNTAIMFAIDILRSLN